jgi:hypothetical protein
MEISFNKQEIEKAVKNYALAQSLSPDSVDVGIKWDPAAFAFPPNFGEMLAHCSIKAVIGVKEIPFAKPTAQVKTA